MFRLRPVWSATMSATPDTCRAPSSRATRSPSGASISLRSSSPRLLPKDSVVSWPLRGQGLSDGYIRRILGVGQAALNRAFRDGEISAAPVIALALAPESALRERLLSLQEAAALFQSVTMPHQTMYLLLAFATAARPAAILEVSSFRIDCDARLIKLNPPGRKQNKKRRPTLPICDTLLPYLRNLPPGPVVHYQGRALRSFKKAFDRLTRRAARSIREEGAEVARVCRRAKRRAAAWDVIKAAKERATAMLEVTPYTIRHTVATEMRKRGVATWEVAGFLGHSSGYKTTKRYAQFGCRAQILCPKRHAAR